MKSIYDKYGSRGITVAEQLGEDVSNKYNRLCNMLHHTCTYWITEKYLRLGILTHIIKLL